MKKVKGRDRIKKLGKSVGAMVECGMVAVGQGRGVRPSIWGC